MLIYHKNILKIIIGESQPDPERKMMFCVLLILLHQSFCHLSPTDILNNLNKVCQLEEVREIRNMRHQTLSYIPIYLVTGKRENSESAKLLHGLWVNGMTPEKIKDTLLEHQQDPFRCLMTLMQLYYPEMLEELSSLQSKMQDLEEKDNNLTKFMEHKKTQERYGRTIRDSTKGMPMVFLKGFKNKRNTIEEKQKRTVITSTKSIPMTFLNGLNNKRNTIKEKQRRIATSSVKDMPIAFLKRFNDKRNSIQEKQGRTASSDTKGTTITFLERVNSKRNMIEEKGRSIAGDSDDGMPMTFLQGFNQKRTAQKHLRTTTIDSKAAALLKAFSRKRYLRESNPKVNRLLNFFLHFANEGDVSAESYRTTNAKNNAPPDSKDRYWLMGKRNEVTDEISKLFHDKKSFFRKYPNEVAARIKESFKERTKPL